jgi:hypothetical protein
MSDAKVIRPPFPRKRSEVPRESERSDPNAAPKEQPHPFLDGARRQVAKHIAATALLGADAYEDVEREPLVYTWQDYVQPSDLVMVAGYSYSGKTTLCTLLAAALAAPPDMRPVLLGRQVTPVAAGKVVAFVEEENSRRSFTKKMKTACRLLNLPVRETLDRLVSFVRQGARIRSQDDRAESVFTDLWDRAEAGRIGALFIDSWSVVCTPPGANSNSGDDQTIVTRALRSFVEVSGAPLFVIDHMRKGGSYTIEDIAGSVQKGAAMDAIIAVQAEKDEGVVTSSKVWGIKFRDEPDEPPAAVVLTIVRDQGEPRIVEGGVQAPASKEPAHERVWTFLESADEAKTKKEIREALGLNYDAVEAAVTTLFSERRIRKGAPKRGANGKDYPTFESVFSTDEFLKRNGFNPNGGAP